MNHVAVQGHVFGVVNDDAFAEARGNCGISHALDTLCGIMELDSSEISLLLRAIEDGNIVQVDLTVAVRKVCWLKVVGHKDLAAEWARISVGHAVGVSAGGDVYIAAEKEDFSTHIHTVIAICG